SLPWTRKFAGVVAMIPLALWTLSTNPTLPFYKEWQWWVATVVLLVGWFFLNRWHNPNTHPSQQHAQPAGGGVHGGGPGHGTNGPVLISLTIVGTVAVVILAVWSFFAIIQANSANRSISSVLYSTQAPAPAPS